jgi:hypothetical protein
MSRVQRGRGGRAPTSGKASRQRTVELEIDPTPCPKPDYIISGGQTGADRGGLMAAKELNIRTDGWLPNNLRTEDNAGAQVRDLYGLRESDGGYAKRDRQNVDMSDCLIAFLLTKPMTGRGTTLTFLYALHNDVREYALLPCPTTAVPKYQVLEGRKNTLVMWDVTTDNYQEYINIVRSFLRKQAPKNLMISGPCESTSRGTQDAVKLLLLSALGDGTDIHQDRTQMLTELL